MRNHQPMKEFLQHRLRLGFLALMIGVGWMPAGAADNGAFERGRQIWESQCMDCHGAQGEGVDDGYDEPLYGNWSIGKLTRIIHKTMPEELPEECEDEDAEAVAKYIYDAFYSLEARARLTPRPD